MRPLAVLLYHTISDDPPPWIAHLAVTPRDFRAQLDAVAASGRVPVTAAQVVEARRGGAPLPPDAVALTFDDGFRDFATIAQPALAARGLPAALFVTTGALHPDNRSRLPDAPMLTLRDIAQLDRDGVEICSHTHLHTQLDTLDRRSVERELTRPKQILQDAIGREVPVFAYPYGYSSRTVRALAGASGYAGAFAVRHAFSPDTDDPYRIARLMLRCGTDLTTFHAWLDGERAPIAPAREHAKTCLWRQYRRRRAALTQALGSRRSDR
jgi:peptidoglycan/xylan/chitin deacetylase (PgdA/CDA1 family)